ncbi:hypothetical protein NQ315_001516 [Exocentrus adspersus]|uniref:Uncharacterized protein n=1 Tax=Exocentrus adspersus TaxID=1586481 RepID=A0AAV8WA87_9CUCU|nr:hypothetical protein NQ315_001516 [Exocentrus adspersus]
MDAITEQNHVDTCWVTTALSALLFFMMLLLLMSSITSSGLRVPRCVTKDDITNDTIHLVHTTHVDDWRPFELDLLERIVENYPTYKIRLILIQDHIPSTATRHTRRILEVEHVNASSTTTTSTTTEKQLLSNKTTGAVKVEIKKRHNKKKDGLRLSINMSAKRLLDILLHGKSAVSNINDTELELVRTPRSAEMTTKRVKTINDLLGTHSNIILDNTTYNHVFYMSPLYAYWPFLNEKLRIFSVRVLQLWQYGGISFDLTPSLKLNENETVLLNQSSNADAILGKKLLNFIITERKNYEKLPVGVVTADDEALHMESKIPCHAFFGEVLMNLRKAQDETSVKDVLQESLRVFCKHSAANKKYCDILTKVQ